MEFLQKVGASSPAQIINTICDSSHLSKWDEHIDFLVKNKDKDDKLLVKTVILLGTKISCDNLGRGGEAEEDEEEQAEWKYREVCEKQVKILTRSCRKDFLELLTSRTSFWSLGKGKLPMEKDELERILVSLHSFCQAVISKLPYLGKDLLPNLICTAIGILAGSQQNPSLLHQFSSLQQKIQEINASFESEKEVVVKKGGFTPEFERYLHSKEPPQDFRKIEIVPTLQELLQDKRPFLRPNKIVGPYHSPEHYLDVQFRLLREDFVQPLRKGVEHFLENKEEYLKTKGKKKFKNQQQDASVRIYTGITLDHTEKSKEISGKVYLFKLPQELARKVNWKKSKKLLPGCLVMLTSDCCETAIFATTLAPPFDKVRRENRNKDMDPRRLELSEGILRVTIEKGEEHLEKHLNYIMFECEAYFEAYRHNLAILQKTKALNDESAMGKFIVDAKSSIGIPSYLKRYGRRFGVNEAPLKLPCRFPVEVEQDDYDDDDDYFLEIINNFNNFNINQAEKVEVKISLTSPDAPSSAEVWPDSLINREMGLDANQYEAYKGALTSELSIIQGPPGTGKTFIGLQIVKTLLLNKARKRALGTNHPLAIRNAVVPNSPILILCYTNHALDQFLELLLREIQDLDLIRVGGQCKSEILTGHSLQQQRYKMEMNRKEEKQYFRMVKQQEAQLSLLCNEIKQLENPRGIFCFDMFNSGMTTLLKLPLTLRHILGNGEWLGVPEDVSKSVELELKEMVLSSMEKKKKKERSFSASSITQNGKKGKGKILEEENEDGNINDNEDYDMDELLEHRLADTYYYQDKFEQNHHHSYYLSNCSAAGCLDKFREIENKIFNANETGSSHPRDLYNLEYEKEDYLNRAKILAAIFDLKQDNQLELPNVDKLLQLQKRKLFQARTKIWNPLLGVNVEIGEIEEDEDEDEEENQEMAYVFTEPFRTLGVHKLKMRERWALYFKVVEIALGIGRKMVVEIEEKLEVLRMHLKDERLELDGMLLGSADVVGMTTTGAAKNQALLEIARPQIVVIEEAAEILEAHIVTSLTKDCNQLILIGDHLQLRPSTNVYQLEHKYHMNVSLFERMIMNKLTLHTLKTQHRMRPEIADLIVGPIYEQLFNHPKVHLYPSVKGVTKNLFFLTHSQLEDTDAELLSKSNFYEANFLCGFTDYLLQQGYKPSQITILTTYTGQMFLLKKLISTSCIGVRITCVDNYQGEENDIILLSLVRSNEEDKIGFVGIENRICVSLSRAKHGMFIVGNLESLCKTSKTWQEIGKKLEAGRNFGESLELRCFQHGNKTKVSERSHFAPLKLGGCGLKCDMVLACAHRCPLYCHAQDHEQYPCQQRCEKRCEFEHKCHAKCSKECPPCQTPVMKALVPCGHELAVPCSIDPLLFPCPRIITKELRCELKHKKDLPCHVDVKSVTCEILVEKTLTRCGHVRVVKCGEPQHRIRCDFEIDHIFPTCNHTRRILCYQKGNVKCLDACGQDLDCGHQCTLSCHVYDDPTHKKYVCREACKRVCILGHACISKHRCYGRCPPCQTLVPKSLECGHVAKLPCHKLPATHKCTEPIPTLLPCGHEQEVRCGRKAEDFKCKAKCEKKCISGHLCGVEHACHEECPPCQTKVMKNLGCYPDHKALLPCHEDGLEYECMEQVEKELDCGHTVKDECHLDPDEILCSELCFKKYLECGHERYIVCFLEEFMLCQQEACRAKRLEAEQLSHIFQRIKDEEEMN
ncbi:unnamed protein product [Orchesella dallaii]|uniref:NF-X1-type domain-containing protein n=1 Tax=Orchesella dallaii TaxID=48710 RepID=A0ABP1S3U9_9HEXA